MSHFLALVFVRSSIVQQGNNEIVQEIIRLIAPFDRYPTSDLYNPMGKWDGWEIGGRWINILPEVTHVDKNSPSALSHQALLSQYSCRVSDLPYDLIPFAIITPDGRWYSEGAMRSFNVSTDHDPYWEDKVDSLRAQYADCVAVVLDCHV
jgi:hypothetical protein